MKIKIPKIKPVSKVLIIGILAFVGVIFISQIKLHKDIKRLSTTCEDYSKQISEYDEDNSRLYHMLDGENASQYMEQYAREQLDYIKPNERVYADSDS
ncbi:MAG TPA: hypothetical protein DDY98_08210 [Ruminococcaceae bacterium]|nr:hypothetical protein [Oscillospiraceae bacterium]